MPLSHQERSYLCCNANDCIHQRSFVSYSLCSLSFLSQTLAILQHARRCVNSSISHCQRYPYQAKQGALGMTCQVAASSCLPTLLCLVRFFVLILWSAFLNMVRSVRPTNTSGKTHWNLWKHQALLFPSFCMKWITSSSLPTWISLVVFSLCPSFFLSTNIII